MINILNNFIISVRVHSNEKLVCLLAVLMFFPFSLTSTVFAQSNIQKGESVVLPRRVVTRLFCGRTKCRTWLEQLTDAYLAGGKIVIEV